MHLFDFILLTLDDIDKRLDARLKYGRIGIMVEFPIGYQQRGLCVYWVPTARSVCLLGTNSAVCVSIGYQQPNAPFRFYFVDLG
jgi:hypothetical protein